MRRLPTCAAMVLLASCTVGPNYTRPTVPLPGRYAEAVTSSGVRDPQLAHWWTRFEDPLLDQLIDRIEADAPRTGDDAIRFRGWIRDWRTYLKDRREYTRQLRRDPGARLLLDVNKAGDSVDRAITNFADINDSPSCDAPGDVS